MACGCGAARRGGYRGAGRATLPALLAAGDAEGGAFNGATALGDTGGALGGYAAAGAVAAADEGADEGTSESELAAAVTHIAELAQLGCGSASMQFPLTLEDYYDSCQDEQPFRVGL